MFIVMSVTINPLVIIGASFSGSTCCQNDAPYPQKIKKHYLSFTALKLFTTVMPRWNVLTMMV